MLQSDQFSIKGEKFLRESPFGALQRGLAVLLRQSREPFLEGIFHRVLLAGEQQKVAASRDVRIHPGDRLAVRRGQTRPGQPYTKNGSVFGNREKLLPARRRGYYREYTVRTPGARDRGARRIVAGAGNSGDVRSSGEYYYSDDHYNSFRRIRE